MVSNNLASALVLSTGPEFEWEMEQLPINIKDRRLWFVAALTAAAVYLVHKAIRFIRADYLASISRPATFWTRLCG